jgi:putative isomerase
LADPGARRLPAGAWQSWNTWDAAWPASLVQLASEACLRIGAYSASAGTYTGFRWSPAHTLGRHQAGGGHIAAEFAHAGTSLRLTAEPAGESAVRAELRSTGQGEWGLRFWLVVEFGPWDEAERGRAARLLVPAGEQAYTDPPAAVLDAAPGGLAAALCPRDRPADLRMAASPGAIGQAMQAAGYYTRPPAPAGARYAVFRFAMTEPVVTFAAAAAPTPAAALDQARQALAQPAANPVDVTSLWSGEQQCHIDRVERAEDAEAGGEEEEPNRVAVRDVLGWNTVWDRRNRRPYTASTRAWIDPKFGGFGVWQIDGFLHAVLAAHLGESWLAWANLDAVLDGRAAAGNLAALTAGTTWWADRSHPPFGGQALWTLQAMVPDDARRDRAARLLADAYRWWFRARGGNRNGLLEYGSSPVGDGHFVHTRQAAMDESANDNSPVHDAASFDPATHTLDVADVGLNSLLVHEGGMLARLLADAGHRQQARLVAARASALADRVRERLWDPARQVFAGRHRDGRFTASLAPTSFYPLLAGIATRPQAEAMVREWLTGPDRFGGDWPVAGTPHGDPAAADNTYWRGRTWPCFNYAVYLGLRRYRYDKEATWLARRGLEMFGRGWAERRCYENFSQRTGEGGDSPDAEPFYTWGALLPFLADADLIGTDPWDGVTFGRDGAEDAAATTSIAGQPHRVTVTSGSTELARDGQVIFTAGQRGRFRGLRTAAGSLLVEVPPAGQEVTVTVTLPRPPDFVRLDGTELPAEQAAIFPDGPAGRGTVTARLPASAQPRRLEIGSLAPGPDGKGQP